ncbi:MAG: methyltransferase domain-containing protein [Spirochaetia bacterium]|nr:methyltransferase domain-containing protein [Spirochaetia bacterium]
MNEGTLSEKIQIRYLKEAGSNCCLSCGGALDFADLKEGETMIDLGSGRGHDVIKAADMVTPSGHVYGIDFTDEMIKTAEKNIEKLKITNAKILKSDISNIPLESETVDAVISNCVINHALDKEKVFREIFRLLKTGGRFIVSDVISESELPEEVKNDPEAWAKCYGGAIPKNDYFSAVENAGFNNIDILEESNSYEKGGVLVRSITIRSYKK